MNILILTGGKDRATNALKQAFSHKGFSRVDSLSISKLNLVSRGGKTKIVNGGLRIEDYDAVYLRAGLKLTAFVEPLLDELKNEHIYVQVRRGAYYVNGNEALQLSALNGKGIPIAKTVLAGNPKLIKDSIEKFRYPVIMKSFVGQKKIQTIIIETPRSLRSFTKSFKMELDAVVLREFEDSDLVQCAVIGGKVFAIKRRWNGTELERLSKGIAYSPSDSEKVTAIQAARACKCEIATVKLSKGLVTGVLPEINFVVFNRKTGENLYESVASFFHDRASGIKLKRPKQKPSFFDQLSRALEGVFNG